jgi:DNA primase
MTGKIPDETLDAIRDRVSLVEVVSGYVSLKKSGRNYLGLCPFHSEKTPSFTVSDERGLFHCFGCGAGGTIFSFLMRAEHCTFPEAVRSLAQRAGISLPERGQNAADDYRQNLLRLNEIAQKYLRIALQSDEGRIARRYLEKRGLGTETVERYGLGFCSPAGTAFIQAIASKPRAVEAAIHLGLVGRRPDGGTYERFRSRITFPIRDGSGRILGFGGRALGDQLPKYLNSPESALFHKGRLLYGLFEARAGIREAERVVILFGYMDSL